MEKERVESKYFFLTRLFFVFKKQSPEEPVDAVVVQPTAVAEEPYVGVVDHSVVVVEDLRHGWQQPSPRLRRWPIVPTLAGF